MRLSKIVLSGLYTSCILLSTSTIQAQSTTSYNGISAGFDTGLMIANASFNDQSEKDKKGKITKKNSPFDKSFSLLQFPAGIHIDYHISDLKNDLYKDIYLGLGLNVGTAFGSPSKIVLDGKKKLEHGFGLKGTVTLKQKRKFYAEITPRLGFKFNNASIIYVLLSVRQSKLESTLTSTGDITKGRNLHLAKNTYKYKSSRIGVAPGIGFNTMLGDHWSVGAEYKYFFEKDLRFADGKVRASSETHNLLAKVSYHF